MKAIVEKIGSSTITFQIIEENMELVGGMEGRATLQTGIEDKVEPVYAKIKNVVKEIATDFGTELKAIEKAVQPNEVEIEFQIGFSAQVGPIWLLGGKGESSMTVKMTWNVGSDEKPTT